MLYYYIIIYLLYNNITYIYYYMNNILTNPDLIIENSDILNKNIDCCIELTSDYNISLVIYTILKNNYRYIGNKKWDYYNNIQKTWIVDENSIRLKHDIKTIVCNYFLIRFNYWENLGKIHTNDIDYNNDCQFKANKLLVCSNKLKQDKFISVIIKEARSFFEYNE